MEALGPGDPREVGPYRLAGVLGAGGMGRVYLGHSRSGRSVAIKMVHDGLAANPDFRARFAREIAAARAVSGVFTAAVVDADPAAPRPWLATAYVEAPTLAQYVATHGPLPEPSLRFLAAGLAEALDAIHRAGVIHRDLKPSNVLLAPDGPRVIDFGIARALDAAGGAEITGAQQHLGTVGFMAPEQLTADAELGPACDVFCLGLVLCFAAGVRPFGDVPAQALMYRIVFEDADISGVPAAARAIVAACLDKDPAARPTSAQVLDQVATFDAMAPAPTVKMPRGHGHTGTPTRVGPPVTAAWLPPTRIAEAVHTVVPTVPPTEPARQVEEDLPTESAHATPRTKAMPRAQSGGAESARTQAVPRTQAGAEATARTQAVPRTSSNPSAEAAARTQAVPRTSSGSSAEAAARTQAVPRTSSGPSARTQAVPRTSNGPSAEATARTQAVPRTSGGAPDPSTGPGTPSTGSPSASQWDDSDLPTESAHAALPPTQRASAADPATAAKPPRAPRTSKDILAEQAARQSAPRYSPQTPYLPDPQRPGAGRSGTGKGRRFAAYLLIPAVIAGLAVVVALVAMAAAGTR